MASKPALFVVCREDEESGDLVPFLVTANYDDIIGYQEVDDQVFRCRFLRKFIAGWNVLWLTTTFPHSEEKENA